MHCSVNLVHIHANFWRAYCTNHGYIALDMPLVKAQDVRDKHEGMRRKCISLDNALKIERNLVR